MTVNYNELCAYIARRADFIARFSEDILLVYGYGYEGAEATEADRAQAIVEATDACIEDFFRDRGLLSDDPWTFPPSIVTGQPKNAPCRKMRGY